MAGMLPGLDGSVYTRPASCVCLEFTALGTPLTYLLFKGHECAYSL